jgi:hypothetical protein
MWDKNKEKTYQKIKKGDATISEIISTFQPFKPFLFGNSIESTGIELEGTMSKVRVST